MPDRFSDISCFVCSVPSLGGRAHRALQHYRGTDSSIEITRWRNSRTAWRMFILGFAKKILLANPMGRVADAVFCAHAPLPLDAWFGVIAYAFQIYFDFSGYSDMAVGLGRMFGFVIPKNFSSPYLSESITDFWRRWHISLSTWLRDYLYLPLGGNAMARDAPTSIWHWLCCWVDCGMERIGHS